MTFLGGGSPYALYNNMERLINKFTNQYICFQNLFKVREAWDLKASYLMEAWQGMVEKHEDSGSHKHSHADQKVRPNNSDLIQAFFLLLLLFKLLLPPPSSDFQFLLPFNPIEHGLHHLLHHWLPTHIHRTRSRLAVRANAATQAQQVSKTRTSAEWTHSHFGWFNKQQISSRCSQVVFQLRARLIHMIHLNSWTMQSTLDMRTSLPHSQPLTRDSIEQLLILNRFA